jgi:hypothetical protein
MGNPRYLISHRTRRGDHDAHPEQRGYFLVDRELNEPDGETYDAQLSTSSLKRDLDTNWLALRTAAEPSPRAQRLFRSAVSSTMNLYATTTVSLPEPIHTLHILSKTDGLELQRGFAESTIVRGPTDSAWNLLVADVEGRGFEIRKRRPPGKVPSVRPVQLIAPPNLLSGLGIAVPAWLRERLRRHQVGTTVHLEDIGLTLRQQPKTRNNVLDWWDARTHDEQQQTISALRWLLLRSAKRLRNEAVHRGFGSLEGLQVVAQRDQLESLLVAARTLTGGQKSALLSWLKPIEALIETADTELRQAEPKLRTTRNQVLLAAKARGDWWAQHLEGPEDR